MEERKKEGMGFISSTSLLSRTGISRATLNNYIKMGMIPSPIVKKPDDPHSKAKRIGYFGDFAVDVIENIRLYKKKRRTMNEIVSLLSLNRDDRVTRKDDPGTIGGRSTYAANQEKIQGTIFTSKDDVAGLKKNSNSERLLPDLVSFSVIVAGLQDSMRICAELPPEEYFLLIHQIWKCMETSCKKYHGAYGKYAWDGMTYYFLKECDDKYCINTIRCALDIKNNMKIISNDWKKSKSWFNELYLNIGINEGDEYFGTISAAPTTEFISFGGSADCAMRISKLARSGSILTTKNLLNRLDEVERKQISYGIHHDPQKPEVLIENVFSRIMDMVPQNSLETGNLRDIATLSITELLNLR
jgi:class 3 adenylate cyclase